MNHAREDLIAAVTFGAAFGPVAMALFGFKGIGWIAVGIVGGALVGCLTTGLSLVARRRKRVERVVSDRGGHVVVRHIQPTERPDHA